MWPWEALWDGSYWEPLVHIVRHAGGTWLRWVSAPCGRKQRVLKHIRDEPGSLLERQDPYFQSEIRSPCGPSLLVHLFLSICIHLWNAPLSVCKQAENGQPLQCDFGPTKAQGCSITFSIQTRGQLQVYPHTETESNPLGSAVFLPSRSGVKALTPAAKAVFESGTS